MNTIGLRNSWSFILSVVQLYACFGAALLALFEGGRHLGYCYASRAGDTARRAAAHGPRGDRAAVFARRSRLPLGWAKAALRCPDEALVTLHGLDAFACVAFLRLCLRLALAACGLSCGFLLPLYYLVARDAGEYAGDDFLDDEAARERHAFLRLTLRAAISSRSADGPGDAVADVAAAAAVAAAWALALAAYAACRAAYRSHRDARLEWILRGDPDWPREATYTVLLQHLPPSLRDDAALARHLETLFPGAVAAARVVPGAGGGGSSTGGWSCVAALCDALPRRRGSVVRRARLSTEDGLDCLTDALVDRTEGFLETEDGDDEVEVEAYADDARRRGGQSGQLPLFLEELYLLSAGRTSRSSAFATFRTLGAAAVAASTKLSHRAFTTLGEPAPAPGDVLWRNAASSLRQRRLRTWVVDFVAVPVAGGLWVSFISYVGLALQSDAARRWCGSNVAPLLLPFLRSNSVEGIDDDDALQRAAADFAAKTLATGVGLFSLLAVPWVAYALAACYERPLSRGAVQVLVFRRYALFQFLWIYVSLISLSVEGLGELLARNPRDALELLCSRIAEASGYFVSVLVIKAFFGLAWELARPWPLFSKTLARYVARRRRLARNPFDDGDELACPADPARYGWILPNVVVVACILFTFAVITPLLTPFAVLYFGCAYVVYKHQLLFVFAPPAQLGGAFFPLLLQSLLNALTASQVVLFGFFLSAQAWGLASFAFPLPFVSQLVALSLRSGYHDALRGLPLNVARHVDKHPRAREPHAGSYAGPEAAAAAAAVENPLRRADPEFAAPDDRPAAASVDATELVPQS